MTRQHNDTMTIPQYFAGKSVFITGATGFMGKVLIEKILWSCPDVSKVFILAREKKGKAPQERVKAITDLALFDRLRREKPENLSKIVPVVGDVKQIGLGLSVEDRQKLANEVNIIYHAAASVRFDDPLKDAILLNTRGTREIALLAREVKNLEVFVHVSTSYSNTDKQVIDEKIYEPIADWRKAIEIAENVDSNTIDILTQKFIHPLPNTYTFTKNLAEHVVKDLCEGVIPSVVFRPSIVISSVEEPLPGWIDNFNGPVGILAASGKGILRSVYTQPKIVADYIPVDVVIRALMVATWLKGMEKDEVQKYKLDVYNGCNNNVNNISIGQLVDYGKDLCWEIPLNDIVWYPNGGVTTCYYYHFLKIIFYHLLPAIFIDGLLMLLGRKPMLFRIQRKIYTANMALQYFITQEWTFINHKSNELDGKLLPADVEEFRFFRDVKTYDYIKTAVWGAREYLLKEDMSTFESAKAHSRRMWVLAQVVNTMWYMSVFLIFFFNFSVGTKIALFITYVLFSFF